MAKDTCVNRGFIIWTTAWIILSSVLIFSPTGRAQFYNGSLLTVAGTGKYYKSSTDFAKDDGNAWLLNPVTGKKTPHLTMTLDYTVTGISAGNTYHFTDTLVMRDNAMVFQTFSPYSPQGLTGY